MKKNLYTIGTGVALGLATLGFIACCPGKKDSTCGIERPIEVIEQDVTLDNISDRLSIWIKGPREGEVGGYHFYKLVLEKGKTDGTYCAPEILENTGTDPIMKLKIIDPNKDSIPDIGYTKIITVRKKIKDLPGPLVEYVPIKKVKLGNGDGSFKEEQDLEKILELYA